MASEQRMLQAEPEGVDAGHGALEFGGAVVFCLTASGVGVVGVEVAGEVAVPERVVVVHVGLPTIGPAALQGLVDGVALFVR